MCLWTCEVCKWDKPFHASKLNQSQQIIYLQRWPWVRQTERQCCLMFLGNVLFTASPSMPTLGEKSRMYLHPANQGGEWDQSSALGLYSTLGKGQFNPCETTTMSHVMRCSSITHLRYLFFCNLFHITFMPGCQYDLYKHPAVRGIWSKGKNPPSCWGQSRDTFTNLPSPEAVCLMGALILSCWRILYSPLLQNTLREDYFSVYLVKIIDNNSGGGATEKFFMPLLLQIIKKLFS